MKGNLPYFYIKENPENTRGIRIYTLMKDFMKCQESLFLK